MNNNNKKSNEQKFEEREKCSTFGTQSKVDTVKIFFFLILY